jgi:hypothetical protein
VRFPRPLSLDLSDLDRDFLRDLGDELERQRPFYVMRRWLRRLRARCL